MVRQLLLSSIGLLGLIFNKSQSKFQNPAKLRRLIVEDLQAALEQFKEIAADLGGEDIIAINN